MALIQFTRNHRDSSTSEGFQFEFCCDRCGNGYQTRFQASNTGRVTTVLNAANTLLGGIFGKAADLVGSVRSAAWEQEHDHAFAAAGEEVKPFFHKCKRCGSWVDGDCWNNSRTLCKTCAPDLEEEFSAVQVEVAVMDAREKASQVDYVSSKRFQETIVASCLHCGAPSSGGKFCGECGKPFLAKKFCISCGQQMAAGVKFCPEYGSNQVSA